MWTNWFTAACFSVCLALYLLQPASQRTRLWYATVVCSAAAVALNVAAAVLGG